MPQSLYDRRMNLESSFGWQFPKVNQISAEAIHFSSYQEVSDDCFQDYLTDSRPMETII